VPPTTAHGPPPIWDVHIVENAVMAALSMLSACCMLHSPSAQHCWAAEAWDAARAVTEQRSTPRHHQAPPERFFHRAPRGVRHSNRRPLSTLHVPLTCTPDGCRLQMLYDLVYEKEDPDFDGASKTHRDTKNHTMTGHDRSMGGMLTTSNLAFQPATDFSKPSHPRKPIVRDTFYRKTNIFFPDGCAAQTE
jgi:hypothetical protein